MIGSILGSQVLRRILRSVKDCWIKWLLNWCKGGSGIDLLQKQETNLNRRGCGLKHLNSVFLCDMRDMYDFCLFCSRGLNLI